MFRHLSDRGGEVFCFCQCIYGAFARFIHVMFACACKHSGLILGTWHRPSKPSKCYDVRSFGLARQCVMSLLLTAHHCTHLQLCVQSNLLHCQFLVLCHGATRTYQRSKLAQVMRHHQDGALILQLLQRFSHFHACSPVQASQGLIQQQHLRMNSVGFLTLNQVGQK